MNKEQIHSIATKIVSALPTQILENAINYLHYYGYFTEEGNIEHLKKSVSDFQEFFGLEQTGELDGKTWRAMLHLRCGVKDVFRQTENVAWNKNRLTYKIVRRDTDLSVDTWDSKIRLAWDQWQNVSNIVIERTDSNSADVIVSTGSGRRDNFDGPSGTLAWCEMPNGRGNQLLMQFDVDETWISDVGTRGILLLNVACHEFGHALGLEHSRTKSALMAPYYSQNVSKPQENDDIPRIQAYYGKPTVTPATPTGDNKMVVTVTGRDFNLSIDGYRLVKTN